MKQKIQNLLPFKFRSFFTKKKPKPIPLMTKENTLWIICHSTVPKDVRHITDSIYSISKLKESGIDESRIICFSNTQIVQPTRDTFEDYGISVDVEDLLNLETYCKNFKNSDSKIKHVVFVCGGHGDLKGIKVSNDQYLSPMKIVDSLRNIENVDVLTLVLCQCYAGIFNFINAKKSPSVFIMAATNIKLSVSVPDTKVDPPICSPTGKEDITKFHANSFQFHFFDWLKNPQDIDGDGEKTILDAYRYASGRAYMDINGLKVKYSYSQPSVRAELKAAYTRTVSPTFTQQDKDDLIFDLTNKYFNVSTPLYNVENPWALNAYLGQKIKISL